ncbi:MAG TPA: alkaline phosphatase family protein [Candidatus Babeliales bacterium]|nr:alkaline phosphatase family protein [Candidatus Babeliales bacterium]
MKVFSLPLRIAVAAASFVLGACGGGGSSSSPGVVPNNPQSGSPGTPIQHVVLIVQENRSFDNFFAKFPGADGATRGEEEVLEGSKYVDKWVTLQSHSLIMSTDLQHCHKAFETSYDGGKMDGFDLIGTGACGGQYKPAGTLPYQYVKEADIQPYWDMAEQWVLADHMFQTQGSGSFTAHQDLIRGGTCITSIASCETPSQTTLSMIDTPDAMPWGCNSPSGARTWTINYGGDVVHNGPFPCSDDFPDYGSSGYETLRDLFDAAGVSWKYYTPCFSGYSQGCPPSSKCPDCSGDTLNAFDVIYPVRYGSEWGTKVSMPDTNIFNDISGGTLPNVSWVIPEDDEADHPGYAIDKGPEWVASVVNALGESSYWDSTAIFILWDDWGGFYDSVAPPFQDKFGGLGFRVPCMVISPYDIAGSGSQGGYVEHTQYEFGSILKYIEVNWGLPSLHTTDARATSIGNVFDYSQKPRAFNAIPSKYTARYFLNRPHPPQHGDPQ